MFKRKYLFETNTTRNIRFIKISLQFTIGIFALYSLLCIILAMFSQHESEKSSSYFYKRQPDLITILTGDAGRIPYGLKKANEYHGTKVFITGVYSKNTTELLLKKHNDLSVDINSIEIDHARNTVENVLSILRFTKSQNNLKNVLIITHDYHLLRTKLILETIKDPNDKINYYYLGISSNYFSWRSIKILYKEVFKIIRASAFLTLWENGSPNL